MSESFRVANSSNLDIGKQVVSESPDHRFVRTLIHTGFIFPHQNPEDLLLRFTPDITCFDGSDKVVCIGSKVVSIMQGRYKRANEVKPGIFANLASPFRTKTDDPDEPIAYPRKLQVAIDEVGIARVGLAAGVSAVEKLALKAGILKKRLGLFFLIAGKKVEVIDGLFDDGGYKNHVILCPDDYNHLSDQWEQTTGLPNAVVDINYQGGSVLSVSRGASYTKQEIFAALSDNPFGQDKRRMPIAVIGRI